MVVQSTFVQNPGPEWQLNHYLKSAVGQVFAGAVRHEATKGDWAKRIDATGLSGSHLRSITWTPPGTYEVEFCENHDLEHPEWVTYQITQKELDAGRKARRRDEVHAEAS